MPTQNLVQIQRDLQSLPPGPQTMMYLKRAKDGMVATVPPYVAAAELAAREKMAHREALASGAASGEQPTVSQQLSQKADLLALQAMKKKEMDAQAANAARTAPGPAPEGSPEPEEQPQPEGGLASLPVDFKFDGGGLVAFTPGGSVSSDVGDISGMLPSAGQLPKTRADLEEERRREEERQRMEFLEQTAPELAAKLKAEQAAKAQAAAPGSGRGLMPGRTAANAITAVPGSGQQRPPAPPAPPAAPAAPQQPAAPSPQQSVEAALMQRLGLTPGTPGLPAAAAPTMAGTGADIKAAQAMFGLDKAAGEEERGLIAEMRARHAQQQKDRARMGLKAVLGGFSQGYGGAAAADVAASQRAYAEDMAQQQEMYKLINAINTGNRKEAEKAFEKTVGLQQQREQDVNAMSRTQLQAMVSMYGNLLQADSNRYNTDAHVRVALLNAKKTDERATREDKKIAIDGLQSAERGIQTELTKLQGLMDKGSKDRRAQLDEDLRAIRAQIAKIAGVETPARAAAPAAPGKVVNWSDIK